MYARSAIHMLMGAAVVLGLGAAPAPAAALPAPMPADDCILPPGVYGIMDSQGNLVGILIVYPDCRMEVFRKQEPT